MDEYSQNRTNATERAFKHLMDFDKNILQNYITISKDVKMYNPKNPKAFADMMKERYLMKKNTSCDDLKAFTSIRMPKSDYSHRIHPMIKYNKMNKGINFVERKYQMNDPSQSVAHKMSNTFKSNSSFQFTQKQNLINSKKECMNDVHLNLINMSKPKIIDINFKKLSESNYKVEKKLSSKSQYAFKPNTKNEMAKRTEILQKGDSIENSYNLIHVNDKTDFSKHLSDRSNESKHEENMNKSQLAVRKSNQNFISKTDNTEVLIHSPLEEINNSLNKESDVSDYKSKNLYISNNSTNKNQAVNITNVLVSESNKNQVDHLKILSTEKNEQKENFNSENSENCNVNSSKISKSNNNENYLSSMKSIEVKNFIEKNLNDLENNNKIEQIDSEIPGNIEKKALIEDVGNDFDEKISINTKDEHQDSIDNIDIVEENILINENSKNKVIDEVDRSDNENESKYQGNLETLDENRKEQNECENFEKIASEKEDNSRDIKDNEINLKQNENNIKINNANNTEQNNSTLVESIEKDILEVNSIIKTDQDIILNSIEDNEKNVHDVVIDNMIQKESDELVMSSSLDTSNQSHISIPQDSEDNDSFWN